MECDEGHTAVCLFGGGVYNKGVHDMDRQLRFLLDGREEEQPELFCNLTGRDGKVSDGDLSACLPGDIRISDPLCVCQLLSGRISSGQEQNRDRGVVYPAFLHSDACSILHGAEIGAEEL